MTLQDFITSADTTDIADKEMVLATDLDGTFLGGTKEDLQKFYGWVEANRDRLGLIFVTGRDPAFVSDLTSRLGVPRPDFVIGDVGTTIAEMDDAHAIRPIPALEQEIARAWSDAGPRVKEALEQFDGITLQATPFRYRLSYDMDPDRFDDRVLGVVADMGLDVILSDNRFFDVLPPGVSKGPSLLRLIGHLGIDRRRVLVAGDTMNDLSMLRLGLPAVAVGGSEAALIERMEPLEHAHVAKGIGVVGIAEAIAHHNLFPNS